MTPIAAVLAGLLAGWFIPRSRRPAAFAAIPFVGVLAAQTWGLASGRGNNPASTVTEAGYWVIQLVALALACGIAVAVSTIRDRQARRHDGATTDRVGASTRATVTVTLVATVLATSTAVVLFLANSDSQSTVQEGSGNIPVIGVIGIVTGLLLLAATATALALTRPRRPRESMTLAQ